MKFLIIWSLFILNASAGIHTRHLWKHNNVVVCFAGEESEIRKIGEDTFKIRNWSDKNKVKVQEWINSEYKSNRTGIHFTGWKNCEEAPEADVILFYHKKHFILDFFDNLNGFALLGQYKNRVDGYPQAQGHAIISTSGVNKGTLLHEFGHVAGLSHEHHHPDAANNGKACVYIAPKAINRVDYGVEAYDEKSIMSYCNANKNFSSLSAGDVKLLRKLYP